MALSTHQFASGVDALFFLDPEDLLDLLDSRSLCAVQPDPMYGATLSDQLPRRLDNLLQAALRAA